MGRIVVRSVGDLFVMSIMRFALMSVSRPIRQTAGPTNHLRLAEGVPVELMPRSSGFLKPFMRRAIGLSDFMPRPVCFVSPSEAISGVVQSSPRPACCWFCRSG